METMQELIKRDQKGLYSKALRGLEKNVVGIDIAFDEPNPHLVIHNTIPNCLDEKAHCIVDNVRHLLPKISWHYNGKQDYIRITKFLYYARFYLMCQSVLLYEIILMAHVYVLLTSIYTLWNNCM